MTVQATFVATLVDEWVRAGLTHAVVAPGSRSTPLALALATDGRVDLRVVLDERSAGFMALGIGLASGRPAVVLTTSGTAAVELHPAVVEAHQAGVPLIACTADRPPELHHVGAPQTVEQAGLFAGATRWAFDPGVADAATAGIWRSLGARVWAEATSGPAGPGPVHLNLPFREPLVGEPGPLPDGRPGGRAWHRRAPLAAGPGCSALPDVPLLHAPRGVIVAGRGAGDPALVHRLAAAAGWPVLADPLSGCRTAVPTTVAAFDALLRVERFRGARRPDVVLRLGGAPASKVLAQWLAGLGPDVEQVVVDPYGRWPDPDRTAATLLAASPEEVCRALLAATEGWWPEAGWLAGWQAAEAAAQAAIDSVLAAETGPTEPGIARRLAAAVPDGATLVVSSSMPVRDVEWFGQPRDGLRVLANRGANGIDGVVSTVLGASGAGGGKPVVGLLGDLAFLHDTSGLLISDVEATLVVVDNGGGGIFSFLPQRDSLPTERFEALFGTPQGVDVAAVARAHGWPTTEVGTIDEAPAPLGARQVLVVRTDRDENVRVHDRIHAAVAAAVTD